jgi:hypothetical protein
VLVSRYEGVEHVLDDALGAGEEVFPRHGGVCAICAAAGMGYKGLRCGEQDTKVYGV